MFSPRRSTERKVDRKAKRERFRRMSDSRDNNIKLNLLGVPKDQVSVKKTHQETKNEDLYKIYIDTKNNSDRKSKLESPTADKYGNKKKQGYSSEGSTGDFDKPRVLDEMDTESSDPTKTSPNSDVCLTLPGEKKKDIKIVRRPSETNFRRPLNEQYKQDNVQNYENQQNQPFQLSKEQTKIPQNDRFSIPDRDDMQRNTQNIRHEQSVDRRFRKQGPKQVGFSDYNAVYSTGSEESLHYSGDDMPFDPKSPMVYQVGGTMPESAFGLTGLNPIPDLNTTDGGKRSVTHPPDLYKESLMEPFKHNYDQDQEGQTKKLDLTASPITEQLANRLVMDSNLTPQTHGKLKEQPLLRDNIEQTSLNVIGERHPETRSRNATKPMTVDKEVMTEKSSVTNKGNISNVGSSLSKQLPVSKNPSKESTDINRSSDISKPRKSPVTSIPKPDFGMFRRPKTPKSTAEQGNDPEVQSKTPKDKNEDGIEYPKKETANNVTHKTPRKLTPINVNDRNYKPIFFPPDTNDGFENRNNAFRNVTDEQLENKANKPGQVQKQTLVAPDIRKLDSNAQKRDKTRFPQDKFSLGKSDEISNKTYPSIAVSDDLNKNRYSELIPVDDNVAMLTKFSLNEAGPPRDSRSSNYGTPIQPVSDADDKLPMTNDTRRESGPFDDRMTQSVEKQYHEPYSPVFDGYADLTDQEPYYGVPEGEDDMYGAPVDEKMVQATANVLHSTRPPRDIFGPSKESLEPSKRNDDPEVQTRQLDFTPSPMTEQLANLLIMDGNLTPQTHRKLKEKPVLKEVMKPTSKNELMSTTSLQDPTHVSKEIADKTHGGVKEIDDLSFLSGLHPNDYASTGAIPRTTSAAKSSKGSLKSGQVWPSVGERLSKRGSPFIETIQEEDTDEIGRSSLVSGNKMDRTNEGNGLDGRLPGYDSNGVIDPNYAFGEGNNNIDKDRTNIIAFPGHLADGTPFDYSPSGPDAYPLLYTHPGDTEHKQSTADHDDVTRRPRRMSKASRKRPVSGRVRKQSGMFRGHGVDDLGDHTANEKSAFGQGPREEIIYLGKIPNTTLNVFFSSDGVKGPDDMESKTEVPVRNEKMVSEGPTGILIFVNKKNDHKCPFNTNGFGDKSKNSDENNSTKANKYYDRHSPPNDYGYVKPREGSAESRRARDPNRDKKVTVERTSRGKCVTEKFPCGCYRTTTFDMADELRTEAFISALCTEGSFCEVAHPELAKHNKETVPFRRNETELSREAKNIQDVTKRKRPSYEYNGAFPGIEVIADGVVSNKPIKPRPPGQKMKGANLLASLNIKSNKLNGVCNVYFDPRLKRYLRENLSTILADDEKLSRNRQSY